MAQILLLTNDPSAATVLGQAGHGVTVCPSAHALRSAMAEPDRGVDLAVCDAAALDDVTSFADRCRDRSPAVALLLLRDDPPGEATTNPPGARSLRKPVASSTLLAAVAVMTGGHGQAALDTLLDDAGRVLLHHPDADWRDQWAEAFELDGVGCLHSSTVPEACRLLIATRVDVVLAEQADAEALLAFGRSFGLVVPMVVLGASDHASREQLLAAGALAVFDAAEPDAARRHIVALIDASDAPHP